jgi:hypothetical protein
MKQLTTTLSAILLIITGLFGQKMPYTFTAFTAPYANVPSSNNLAIPGFPEDEYEMDIVLPFSVQILNDTLSKLTITSDGAAFFNSKTLPNHQVYLYAVGCELGDFDATSGIFTETTGNTGNRIFKIEFRNNGIYGGDASDFINFQLWLYEGSNTIEMHYGTHTDFPLESYNVETGPLVGFFSLDTLLEMADTCYYLEGSTTVPTLTADVPSSSNTPSLNGHIAPNTVYRFSKTGTNTQVWKVLQPINLLTVYPNPTAGNNIIVKIDAANADTNIELTLTDVQGKTVLSQTTKNNNEVTLNTQHLAPGIYILNANNSLGWQVQHKVVIN